MSLTSLSSASPGAQFSVFGAGDYSYQYVTLETSDTYTAPSTEVYVPSTVSFTTLV